MKNILFVIFLLISLSVWSQNVVTTTSWVAAYVKTAGVDDVYNFAPAEMAHPPEYVLKPGDVLKIKSADLVVFAGYEAMVKELKGPLELKEDKLLQVQTGYNYKQISKGILAIAEKTGTIKQAEENLKDLLKTYNSSRDKLLKTGLLDKKILIHFHQQSLAKELGLNVVGVFGPGPVKPSEMVKFKKLGAEYIIDNIHSPKGKGLQEIIPEAKYLKFVNFPGTNGTKTLKDVILYNMELISDK